jgi:hypothetical protein
MAIRRTEGWATLLPRFVLCATPTVPEPLIYKGLARIGHLDVPALLSTNDAPEHALAVLHGRVLQGMHLDRVVGVERERDALVDAA